MSNTIITKRILKCDEVNKNKTLIPSDVVEEYLTTVDPNKRFFCTIDSHVYIDDAGDISHALYNLRLEDNYLVGDIEILKTPKGLMLEDMLVKMGDLIYFPAQYMAKTKMNDGVTEITEIHDIKCFASSSPSAFK